MQCWEEEKAKLDGVEIPIQCITRQSAGHGDFSMPHYHDYVEILYGTHGTAQVWMDGNIMEMTVGKMIVVNSGTPHTVRAVSLCQCDYIVIKFMPQVLYGAQQSVFEYKYIMPFMLGSSVYSNSFEAAELSDTEIPVIMEQIVREWNQKDYGFEIALRIYVLKISLWLVRYWHCQNPDDLHNADNTAAMMCIARAMEYAQKNYATATAADAAQYCGLSYSYFSRVFKRYMKSSFNEYLNYIRITEAKRMLVCSDMDITKIAMETGFATTSYFIERFKRECGATPKHFRKQFNND
ncbi:MAG: helix-turn-helix domain-containing protein [Clostridia bacterium]|nr:helix-turn-helix domain-containing protein [Clostridia bacterium]